MQQMQGIDRKLIRLALPADRPGLLTLTDTAPYVHRHLDWRAPLDWLGSPLFWLTEDSHHLLAALACPIDPPGIAWIRFFAAREGQDPDVLFLDLFKKALQARSSYPDTDFAAIALYPWFGVLLKKAGFHLHQEIVVLEWTGIPRAIRPLRPALVIRQLQTADLPDVARVDAQAFGLLWQNTQDGLTLALQQSAYATVAVLDGEVVGYQISTAVSFSAHLARLAVLPEKQGKSIGAALVANLQEHFWNGDLMRVTVNTQGDNLHSLALYQKLGFSLTGDSFDVFIHP
jgi:ribosomal protein S18 acetylase RimI-like enzyme